MKKTVDLHVILKCLKRCNIINQRNLNNSISSPLNIINLIRYSSTKSFIHSLKYDTGKKFAENRNFSSLQQVNCRPSPLTCILNSSSITTPFVFQRKFFSTTPRCYLFDKTPLSKYNDIMVEIDKVLVPINEAKRFAVDAMKAVGTKEAHARALSELLVTADYRGHFSHGINRLPMYVRDIETGICKSDQEPKILKESPATAWVDGNNLLGPVVGMFAMNLAIKKAKESGVGWVACKNSNHFGIAGYYSIMASNQGLIGMAFTNTSPLQVPTRARKVILGTNPIAVTAPAKNGDSFCLDMATSTAAIGKVEYHDRQGIPIPPCWGVDKNGLETQNPKEVLQGGGLLPLGGMEKTGGYKGSGLAMMVEIFCGILSGSTYGPNIRRWMNTERVADLGQCFVAINPEMFAPGFTDRMSDMLSIERSLEPIQGETEVLASGDPERKNMAKCDKEGGIKYHPNLYDAMNELGTRLKITNIKKS